MYLAAIGGCPGTAISLTCWQSVLLGHCITSTTNYSNYYSNYCLYQCSWLLNQLPSCHQWPSLDGHMSLVMWNAWEFLYPQPCAYLLTTNTVVMPTQSLYSALLILGDTQGLPWTASLWQVLTKIYRPPWLTHPNTELDTTLPNVPKWIVKTAQSVKTFANNL